MRGLLLISLVLVLAAGVYAAPIFPFTCAYEDCRSQQDSATSDIETFPDATSATLPSDYTIAGAGDMNGDGSTELLAYDAGDSVIVVYETGGNIISHKASATVPVTIDAIALGNFRSSTRYTALVAAGDDTIRLYSYEDGQLTSVDSADTVGPWLGPDSLVCPPSASGSFENIECVTVSANATSQYLTFIDTADLSVTYQALPVNIPSTSFITVDYSDVKGIQKIFLNYDYSPTVTRIGRFLPNGTLEEEYVGFDNTETEVTFSMIDGLPCFAQEGSNMGQTTSELRCQRPGTNIFMNTATIVSRDDTTCGTTDTFEGAVSTFTYESERYACGAVYATSDTCADQSYGYCYNLDEESINVTPIDGDFVQGTAWYPFRGEPDTDRFGVWHDGIYHRFDPVGDTLMWNATNSSGPDTSDEIIPIDLNNDLVVDFADNDLAEDTIRAWFMTPPLSDNLPQLGLRNNIDNFGIYGFYNPMCQDTINTYRSVECLDGGSARCSYINENPDQQERLCYELDGETVCGDPSEHSPKVTSNFTWQGARSVPFFISAPDRNSSPVPLRLEVTTSGCNEQAAPLPDPIEDNQTIVDIPIVEPDNPAETPEGDPIDEVIDTPDEFFDTLVGTSVPARILIGLSVVLFAMFATFSAFSSFNQPASPAAVGIVGLIVLAAVWGVGIMPTGFMLVVGMLLLLAAILSVGYKRSVGVS